MTRFNITFSPLSGDTPMTLEKQGGALIVNGEAFDFGFLADGDTLPHSAVSGDWLASDVTRTDGDLHLTVRLPHGPNAPEETRFPAPITATQDGPIALPPYDAPQEDEA
tara:strand:- start:1450 stop:1776 length:327 start_codon:yes stop_codon:yes gene_type:complete